MQDHGSRIGLYGLIGAASVGFLGLDQVAASYTEHGEEDRLPHVSAINEPIMRLPREMPAAAPPAKVAETPPRQRPAINGSIGEGSDALDATVLRKREQSPQELAAAGATDDASTSTQSLRARGGYPTSLGEPPIPRATHHQAPPLASDIATRGWSDPESQAERGQRSAENGGPAPLWLEALANQFGIRARFIPLHRPSNTVSRYVDPCDKRDYRCQEFHDNFFREDVETSPLGMANSVGAGVAGGIIRVAGANREIRAPLMWTVKPRFVGLEAAF